MGAPINTPLVGSFEGTGHSVALSSDGLTLALGAPYSSNPDSTTGRVEVRTWNSATESWEQLGDMLYPSGTGEGGYSLALSDDGRTVAMGSPGSNGSAAVYRFSSNAWQILGQTIEPSSPGGFFGAAVSLSADGERIAISDTSKFINSTTFGQVEVFQLLGDSPNATDSLKSWVPMGQPITFQDSRSTGFALSLSDDGSIVAIGSPGAEVVAGSLTGAVNIVTWNSSDQTWHRIGDQLPGGCLLYTSPSPRDS